MHARATSRSEAQFFFARRRIIISIRQVVKVLVCLLLVNIILQLLHNVITRCRMIVV